MYEITFADGSVCLATRVFGVLSARDDAGDKTYFVAQIDGVKRRLPPDRIKSVVMLA